MNRFGKKRTYIAGLMLLVPLFSLSYYLPKNMNVHELYGLMAFIGFAIGGVYVRSHLQLLLVIGIFRTLSCSAIALKC
jgi:hypothetical protein